MTDTVRHNKRTAVEKVDPLPGGKRDLETKDMKKAKALDAFFTSIFPG